MKKLDEKEWREFRIGDLFGISRPVARNKDNYLPGGAPFVGWMMGVALLLVQLMAVHFFNP